MSDALLMPQSIGSIIGSIVTTAFNLGTLARDIANAPAHIQRLCGDAELCRTIVLTIKALLYQIETEGVNKDAQELIYVSTLARALVGCQEVLNLLEQEVEGLMKENMRIGKDDQIRWVWREEEIERNLKSLELRMQALNIALNILNVHQGREIKKQNAHILNSITGTAGDKSCNLLPPQEAIRNIATIAPTGSRRLSTLTLSTVHETESAWKPKPAGDAESSTNTGITPSSNSIKINYLNKSSTSASDARTSTETSNNDSFESTLLMSRVYQKKDSKPNSPFLHSNVTWSELHRSGASIFGYQSRPSLSVAVALAKTRAPVAILTKNRNRLNEALFEAIRKGDITAMSIFLEFGADINAVDGVQTKITPLDLAIENRNIDVVRFLLIHGANCNLAGWFTKFPHVVLQADIIKLLLQHCADAEAINHGRETALFHAARGGHLESVKALLESGVDCNKKNIDGKTPLHIATTVYSNLEVVKLLLQYGADIEAIDNANETALFNAAWFDQLEMVKALLEAGADCSRKNIDGKTPLHTVAIRDVKAEVIKLLLKYGTDIEAMDNQNETALFRAVRNGRLSMVSFLLEAGADCNKRNIDGETLLQIATTVYGNLKVVKLLLQYGANIEAIDNANETALFNAARFDQLEIVKALLEAGADCNKKNIDGKIPLDTVAMRDVKTEVVRLLLQYGTNIEAINNQNETVLFRAARNRRLSMVSFLLEARADCNKKNIDGQTPLYIATKNIEVVKLLLQYGAEIETIDNANETALFNAVRFAELEVVEALLKAGADCNKTNIDGKTPLHTLATIRNIRTEVARLLLKYGADIEVMDNQNETALFSAVRDREWSMVRFLLEAGADCNKKNIDGETPIHIPFSCQLSRIYGENIPEMITLLLQYGADIEAMDNKNETALFSAARRGMLGVVSFLLEAGADCNKKNIDGETPIHIAFTHPLYGSYNNLPEVIELLLRYGADIEAMNNKNETPLFSAVRRGMVTTVKMLLEAGADRGKKNASGQTVLDVAKPGHREFWIAEIAEFGSFELSTSKDMESMHL